MKLGGWSLELHYHVGRSRSLGLPVSPCPIGRRRSLSSLKAWSSQLACSGGSALSSPSLVGPSFSPFWVPVGVSPPSPSSSPAPPGGIRSPGMPLFSCFNFSPKVRFLLPKPLEHC